MISDRDRLLQTSRRLADLGVATPTVLVDRGRATASIERLAARARDAGVRFRPHAKTHQSAAIAEWFRAAGVRALTVSSLEMAAYFADHGWDDLTVAFLANPLERERRGALARRVRLGVVADHPDTVTALADEAREGAPLRVWLKVDVDYGRSGIPCDETDRLTRLATQVAAGPLELAGLLTHAGQTYHARGPAQAAVIFAGVRDRLRQLRERIAATGLDPGEISVGDTPGCVAAPDWRGVDEVRAGNFVFFDLMQQRLGICTDAEIACAVACPVVGVYPEAGRVVVHGGAVHLSKERLPAAGGDLYGELLALDAGGFGAPVAGLAMTSLSQEHGVLTTRGRAGADLVAALRPGDLVLVAPVHSCLTCEQHGRYLTVEGESLARFRRS